MTVYPFLSATGSLGSAGPRPICCLCVPSAWHRFWYNITLRDGLEGVIQRKDLKLELNLNPESESIPLCPLPLMTWSMKGKEQIKTRSDFSLRETLIINRVYFVLGRRKLLHIKNTYKYVYDEKEGWTKYYRVKRSGVSISLLLKERELKRHWFKKYFIELLLCPRNCAECCN